MRIQTTHFTDNLFLILCTSTVIKPSEMEVRHHNTYPPDKPQVCPIYGQDMPIAQDIPQKCPSLVQVKVKEATAWVWLTSGVRLLIKLNQIKYVLNILYLQVCIFCPYWCHTVQEVRLDKHLWSLNLIKHKCIIHKCIRIRVFQNVGLCNPLLGHHH